MPILAAKKTTKPKSLVVHKSCVEKIDLPVIRLLRSPSFGAFSSSHSD